MKFTFENASKFSDSMLDARMKVLFKIEQRAAREIITLINEVERRRLFLKLGYPSLFAWLTDGIGYTNAAAQRRIDSARFLRSVPRMHEEIGDALESGALNLTKLAALQTAIRREEKSTGVKIDPRKKAELLRAIEFTPSYETEKILAGELSGQREGGNNRETNVETVERYPVPLSNEQFRLLDRVKELAGPAYIGASSAAVIEMLAKDFIRRKSKPAATEPEIPRKASNVRDIRRWWD